MTCSPIRMGMVGGGQGAFIGAVHRIAARLDGHFELVAGSLSSDAERAKASALELGIDRSRSYASFEQMALEESKNPNGIEVVAIVTPNFLHFPAAKAFLEAGIHVICDKPLTSTLEDAIALEKIVHDSGKLLVLTHNYTGYPMVRQAREMIENGDLGDIRLVQVEYAQDWLSESQGSDNKQAAWRTDPTKSGEGGCVSDIGTHAFNLARFTSQLEIDSLAADLASFVEDRRVDDNANIMLRFKGGAKGMIWASQVAVGAENALTLRIYGTKGGLEWRQEDPNYLRFTQLGKPKMRISRGGAGASSISNAASRIPGGHPEGYLEGFATIYTDTARAIHSLEKGDAVSPSYNFLPSVKEGVEGAKFVDACVKSSKKNASWIYFGEH